MKKWVNTNKKPAFDEKCKKYADEFISVMYDKGMIINILNQCYSLSFINDDSLGRGFEIDYIDVCFFVCLDSDKKLLQVSRLDETNNKITNTFPFTNNEKICEILNEYVASQNYFTD